METFSQNAARAMMAELGKRPDFFKLAFVELNEFKGKHVPFLIQTIYPEVYPLLQRFMEQRDELRQLPLHVVMLSFLGTFFAYFMVINVVPPTALFEPDGHELEQFIDIFLHGVINPNQNQPVIPGKEPETRWLEHP